MQKRLLDLDPHWHEKEGERVGVMFDCPACDRQPDGKVMCLVHVQWAKPWRMKQDLWEKSGETFESLTLSPSIDGTGSGCKFHGWVREGIVSWN